MTVKEIIEKYLKENGYGGILNVNVPCGCFLDDLVVCDGPCHECQPGYVRMCEEEDSEFSGHPCVYLNKE